MRHWDAYRGHVLLDVAAIVVPRDGQLMTQSATFADGSSKLDFGRWFGNHQPVHLEIGAGFGTWIEERARAYPHINFVANEQIPGRIASLLTRFQCESLLAESPVSTFPSSSSLPSPPPSVVEYCASFPPALPPTSSSVFAPNLRTAVAPAEVLFRAFLRKDSLHTLYVNFPDPWPKRRHAKYRLFSPELLPLIVSRLSPGATIHITTDHLEYLQWSIANLLKQPLLRPALAPPFYSRQLPPDYETVAFTEYAEALAPEHYYSEWRRVPS